MLGVPKETFPGERRVALVPGVGPTNLPAEVPYHASQMYARNTTVVQHLVQREKGSDGKATGAPRLVLDMADEITRESVVTRNGQIRHPRLIERQALGAGR